MTAPIVTPETTLRELGEILRPFEGLSYAHVHASGRVEVVLFRYRQPATRADGHDLADAIDAALVKAGVR